MNDGGPAFPISKAIEGNSKGTDWVRKMQINEGMSLRDWFAGQAMAGFCVLPSGIKMDVRKAAADAYDVAEYMLRERNKRQEQP